MTPPRRAVDEYRVGCDCDGWRISLEPSDVRRDGRRGPVVAIDADAVDGVECRLCGDVVAVQAIVISDLAVSDAGEQKRLQGGGPT